MQADTRSPQHKPRLASMGRVTITSKGSKVTTQQQTERDDALMRVAELAEELIQTGLRNDGHALCVIEKIDKSDPHYRLCAALDELRALRGDEPAKPDREALIAEAEKPVPQGCTLGVGCDEYGICYAEAHGQPEQCGRNVPGDDYRKAAALLRASPAPEPEAFKRENRYIVIKRSHVHPMKEATLRQEMYELGISTVDCVVVEHDWPEYEPVWQMLENRVTGKPSPSRQPAQEVDPVEQMFEDWLAGTSESTDFAHEDKMSLLAEIRRLLSEAEARGRAQIAAGISEYCTTPPAKPDRYLEIWKEAKEVWLVTKTVDYRDDQAAAAVLRRHFEPSAEVIEAAKSRSADHPLSAPGIMRDHILKGDQ